MAIYVKACGVMQADNALFVCLSGVDAIGLNFVAGSKRRITLEHARALRQSVLSAQLTEAEAHRRGRVQWVGVVADLEFDELIELQKFVGLDLLQLHGSESPELCQRLGDTAYKAIRIASDADVELARTYPGKRILVDAKVEGELGGTGHSFDWSLVQELAKQRELILAGGLNPDNVERAVGHVRPFGVDVASGVESAPGIKDLSKLEAFVERARRAAAL